MGLGRFLYISAATALFILIVAAPYLHNEISKPIYSFFALLDHQYPSRSFCLFFQGEVFTGIGDCIEGSPYGKTLFTEPPREGVFAYNKEEVGINRMDTFFYRDRVGYKLPLCARDTALVVGLLLVPLFYRLIRYSGPWLLLTILPLAIDGTLQLFTDYESTNVVRALTGLIAGLGLGAIIYGGLEDDRRRD